MKITKLKPFYPTHKRTCDHSDEKKKQFVRNTHTKVLMSQEMAVTKVSGEVSFKKKPWLKSYISKKKTKRKSNPS